MSKQALKLKKQKKRERQNRQQKLADEQRRREWERRRRYCLTYPEFHFDTGHGNPAFVQAVKKALASLSFEDHTIFTPWEQELYRIVKQHGAKLAMQQLQLLKMACRDAGNSNSHLVELRFTCNLGQAIFDRIPASQREAYLPFNDVMFAVHGHCIDVIFRSLLTAKGTGGTVYYSRRQPTLEIDGVPKVVAFSRHAIERTCERIRPRWKINYAAQGDAFAYFDQCIYFERCDLSSGQLAFTFYEECNPGFVQYRYVDDVLGEENLDPRAGQPYYRVGYCPAVVEGTFVKATTLLFPSYRGTPEYDAILRSPLPRKEKQEMIDRTSKLDAATLYGSQDLSVMRWFHEHGVPQVVQRNTPMFAPPLYPRRLVP